MDEERMNKREFKERMNVWEQLWYFKSIAKTSQVSQITHPPVTACCSGIFVSLQSCKKNTGCASGWHILCYLSRLVEQRLQ